MAVSHTFRTQCQAYLLVNVATLLWAGNVVLGRALRDAAGPLFLAATRAGIASLLFALLLLYLRRNNAGSARWGPGRRGGLLLGMALSGVAGFQVLMYWALRHTSAINAGLINATGPLMALLVLRWADRGHIRPGQVWGAGCSLVGVAVVLSRGDASVLLQLHFNRGDLLALAAVGLWVLYSWLGQKIMRDTATVVATAYSTLLAVPLLAVMGVGEAMVQPPALTPFVCGALLYIGAGPSFVAFLAWNEGVRRLGPTGAMSFYNTLPLYVVAVAALALGEIPSPAQIVGGGLIVLGCLQAALAGAGARPPADSAKP